MALVTEPSLGGLVTSILFPSSPAWHNEGYLQASNDELEAQHGVGLLVFSFLSFLEKRVVMLLLFGRVCQECSEHVMSAFRSLEAGNFIAGMTPTAQAPLRMPHSSALESIFHIWAQHIKL